MTRRFRLRRLTGLATLAVAAVAGTSAYAFTASNTVPNHYAGEGVATVSGYTVTDYEYTFSPDGTKIESAVITLDAAANDVQAALTAAAPGQSDWVDCGATNGSDAVTCTFAGSGIPVGSAIKLSVAAVSHGTVTIAAT